VQVSFGASQKTFERLEWPQVLARLADLAKTPLGQRRFAGNERVDTPGAPALLEASLAGVRERLAETGEARVILAAGGRPPLGGVSEIGDSLARAAKDGVLAALEIRDLGATLGTLYATRRFLERRSEEAPRLAALASEIGEHRDLAEEIERCIDPSGEVSDGASATLAEARRESHRLAAEIQSRAERYLRDPDTVSKLSDSYYTVRNDRYVLPVRADARGSIRGIVHDASNSGTTLFIEPEALVDLNNRRKRAEIEIDRETHRVLRHLSRRAAAEAPAVEAGLRALTALDCAFARAHYAEELAASAPEVGSEGVVRLPQLRHPLLSADEVVPNDVMLGEGFTTLVISGPNAGGKTVTMKAVALAALFVRAGLQVPAGDGARVDLFDDVLADIGDEQNIREHLSTFSAHMANLARIVARASQRSLVVLDEIGVGTDPGEGAALAQAVLEKLADAGARTIATTHFNLLKEMADVDDRFANASVEFDPDTLEPTYRLRTGIPGVSSATAVAARVGLRGDVLERANQILEGEDRQLDRILSELAASRAALEREQQEAAHSRAETEAVRAEHRAKLEKLQERRDSLYRAMREDLDRTFRDAHAQVAGVIRDLQRGGRAQDAARARERLLALEKRTRAAEAEAGIAPGADEPADPVDWQRAHAGDPVQVGGAGRGVLEALPDRRGRVAVRVGGARLLVPRERVSAAAKSEAESPAQKRARVSVEPAPPELAGDSAAAVGAERCDLRGLRVDEAEDRLVEVLDRATRAGLSELSIVHGLGTGALRNAVRHYLKESPYVSEFAAAPSDEGGDGVTIAKLR
jgi:DNA mismatch repair protein MutS2